MKGIDLWRRQSPLSSPQRPDPICGPSSFQAIGTAVSFPGTDVARTRIFKNDKYIGTCISYKRHKIMHQP